MEKAVRVPPPPPPPPAEWAGPEFDDGSWGRFRTPFVGRTPRNRVRLCIGSALLYLRGRFEVTDPARVRAMELSVDYRGGVVVYRRRQGAGPLAYAQGKDRPTDRRRGVS